MSTAYIDVDCVAEGMADLARRGFVVQVLQAHGPGGGNPCIRVMGEKEALLQWLYEEEYIEHALQVVMVLDDTWAPLSHARVRAMSVEERLEMAAQWLDQLRELTAEMTPLCIDGAQWDERLMHIWDLIDSLRINVQIASQDAATVQMFEEHARRVRDHSA